MKIRISSRKAFYCLIAIIIMLICDLITRKVIFSSNYNWISSATIMIIVVLALQLLILKVIIPKNRLLLIVMVVLEFIFHFSHVFLENINYDFGTNTRNNVFFRFANDIVKESTYFGLRSAIAILIGIILFYMFYSEIDLQKERINIRENNRLLAWILLFFGLLADLSLTVIMLASSRFGGYLDVQDAVSNTFYGVRLVSYLLLPGVMLLIEDEKRSKAFKIGILLIFILYKLFTMFSGLRAYALINIFLIVYIYARQNEYFKIKIKHIVLGLIILQLGGGVLVGIRESRSVGVEIETIIQYMFDLRSNIIFNLMGEFGITQNVVALVSQNLNNLPVHCSQLIYSFITVVPGISYLAPNLNYSEAFMEERFRMHNYGGSYIADILYDFGPVGFFFLCICLGVLFAFIFEWYEKNIDLQKCLTVAITSSIIIEILFCVRSSMAKLPRMIAWYLIICAVLIIITNSITKKKRVRN